VRTIGTLAIYLALVAACLVGSQALIYFGHSYWVPRHTCAHWWWC
jgi:hypothetical protein